MGAGFAYFVGAHEAQRTVEVARSCGIDAWVAGTVENGPKQLLVEPKGLRYSAEDLQLR
jgi:phosphoribosylformylglycinamidine cyclo-ligase